MPTFAGQPVDPTSVLLRFTYRGDANLDGRVNIADLSILASNWQRSGAYWYEGDFDYNSLVNIADLSILAANWQAGVDSAFAEPAESAATEDEVLTSNGNGRSGGRGHKTSRLQRWIDALPESPGSSGKTLRGLFSDNPLSSEEQEEESLLLSRA
jgi:hypothetical protein